MHQQSTPINKAFQQTQLNFNIEAGMASKLTNYQKPRPIVIEKLLPYPSTSLTQTEGTLNINPKLSNEKLATAVQLAKLDIKRLKSMLQTDERREKAADKGKVSVATQNIDNLKSKVKKTAVTELLKKRKRYENQVYPNTNNYSKKNIVVDNNNNSCINKKRNKNIYHAKNDNFSGEQKELKNLKLLQEDLEKYTKSLQQIVDQMPWQNSTNNNKLSVEKEEEKKRKLRRAEEQVTRSARMLYMLQHKVHDLENHLNKKKHDIKETKKSEYVRSVSSAHRAAVRTLQMFLNHAPLYYDTSGRLPPIYSELGSLIQQLTRLSMDVPSTYSRSNYGFVEDLVSSLRELEGRKLYSQSERRKIKQKTAALPSKRDFLRAHDSWIKQKVEDSLIQQDDQTPERLATLKHAHEAINDAVKSFEKKRKPAQMRITEGRLKPFNSRLKNYRKAKTRPVILDPRKRPSSFAAPTVTSRIRERPPVEKQTIVTAPPSMPKKSVVFDVDWRTPKDFDWRTSKERDEAIILEAKLNDSLTSVHRRSPQRSAGRSSILLKPHFSLPLSRDTSPQCYNEQKSLSPVYSAEKEIRRQHWLDRVEGRELRRLETMREKNTSDFSELRKEVQISKCLVRQAEKEICERLKPLLDRAETIAQGDEKRAEEFDVSVKRRLADVASQKALSEGERLAEYILDDLLAEAAIDLSCIDVERDAEVNAAFQYDRPTLESIEERLLTFEKEEEAIRRSRQTINFSETKLYEGEDHDDRGERQERHSQAGHPAIIRFTKSRGKLPELPTSQRTSSMEPKNQSPFIDVSSGMFHNIAAQKDKYVEHLKKSSLFTGTFDPWALVSSLSEELLEELLSQVSGELNETCNRFVEDVYEKEFVQPKK